MAKEPLLVPVILASGTEAMLWPAARDTAPKEFSRIVEGPTLFQQAVRLVSDTQRFDAPVIVTVRRHLQTVRGQLAEIGCDTAHIICEPANRGSAVSLALAAELMLGKPDSNLVVLPAGHAVADSFGFMRAVAAAGRLALRNGCISALATRPRRGTAPLGYFRAGDPMPGEGGFQLAQVMAPHQPAISPASAHAADIFCNSGMFVFDRTAMREEYEALAPELLASVHAAIDGGTWEGNCFRPSAAAYGEIEPDAFESLVLARSGRAAIVPAEPGWSGFQTWADVWEHRERDAAGNVLDGAAWSVAARDCLAISDGPVVALAGVEDIVVVARRDAILVTSRSGARHVDALLGQLRAEGVPAAFENGGETHEWGRCETIDRSGSHKVRRMTVTPGGSLPLHHHRHRVEHWIVVRGLATVTVGDRVMAVGPCQQLFIGQGESHRVENLGDEPVEIIEVQYGQYLGEDDVVVGDAAEPAAAQRRSHLPARAA